ncbi:uncharacterized protein LOC139908553 isoform X1 [Centroberyx gerrardi]
MEREEEEPNQIATWLKEEGLAPHAPLKDQLCVLWRALQHRESRLVTVTSDLDTQRSQHIAEMAEVRKSLEQIRIFTEHKDVLAQEIQEENDQLKDQLHRLISLQDAQISEVAKMLYQQGLTELIHSSPSEQVAYLLVERASLLERREDHGSPTACGDTPPAGQLGTDALAQNKNADQSPHKGSPRHGQSPWKRLFGLHKAAQSKHIFIPAEARHLAGQASSVERECSRLERDLEEGSRRLAMAHNEIRRLTDELESAHLTQSAYEPELQGAQQEVEQLRQEVEKLKKREMVELRKAKELNDRLDLEIRALRTRVRSLDAEKNSLQETVVSLQKEVGRLDSALQEQQQLLTAQAQADQASETAKVVSLQKEVGRLDSALQEQQQRTKQQLLTVQAQADQASETAKSQATELSQSNQTCRDLEEKLTAQTRCLLAKETAVVSLQKEVDRLDSALQEQQQQAKQQLLTVQAQADSQAAELIQRNQTRRDLQKELNAQTRCLLEKESEVQSLKQQLDNSHNDLDNLIASICTKENDFQDQKLCKQTEADIQRNENTRWRLEDSSTTPLQLLQSEESTPHKECPDHHKAVKTLLDTQEECEMLKEEICETLKCLDRERSKCHEMNEKHKAKLNRAKLKFDDETKWRDEKMKNLERELSLCAHSLAKEKELIINMTVENEKLLIEKRKLLQQLNVEEHIKNDSILTASLSKYRVDFLEMENKRLGNKILQMSNQLAVLERTLQNMRSLHFAEELKKISNPQHVFLTSSPLQPSSVMMPESSEIRGLLDNIESSKTKQTEVTSSPLSAVTMRPAEMGYLNLTSANSRSDQSAPAGFLSSTDNSCS